MRLSIFSLCISLILIGLVGESQAAIDPTTVAGLWLFDDGAGDTAMDSSGKGLDGNLIDGPQWVNGKFGKALELDGAGAHVMFPDHVNPTEAITISIWVKSAGATWNQHGWVVEKRDAFILHPISDSVNMGFCVVNGAPWNQPHSWDTGAVGPDDITEWHMYTCTFDSATGDWKIFIDAQEASTLECNAAPIAADEGPMYVGNDT